MEYNDNYHNIESNTSENQAMHVPDVQDIVSEGASMESSEGDHAFLNVESSIHPTMDSATEVVQVATPEVLEAVDTTLVKVNDAFKILYEAVLSAKQASNELKEKIYQQKLRIDNKHQELQNLRSEFLATPAIVDSDAYEQELSDAQQAIQYKHCNNLVSQAEQIRQAVGVNSAALPDLISSMRDELKTIEYRAKQLHLLETLNALYKEHKKLKDQAYVVDRKFQSLLMLFTDHRDF